MADQTTLTEQHRLTQIQIRAQALRDFAALWPIWQGDEDSFASLIAAVVTLVTVYRRISAAAAATYYESFRAAADAAGTALPTLAADLPAEQIAASMYVTGRDALREALDSGQT